MTETEKINLFTIPNIITCLNVVCGSLAIVFAFQGELHIAAYFIFGGAFFDFFDGFFARLLKSYSLIGKELDSLADVITFGVAPSAIVYMILKDLSECPCLNIGYFAFIITVFSALRLAKFNIDTRQSDSFIGLPTPANAIFFASIALLIKYFPENNIVLFIQNAYVILALVVVFSFLLISEVPIFSLKFKSFSFAKNKIRYIFIAISVILLIILQLIAIPLIILIYILMSVIINLKIKYLDK